MSDTERYVTVEQRGAVAIVRVDRQEKLNALNPSVIRQLGETFEELRDVDEVRGIIVTGAGEKAFVAGADIGVLAKMNPVEGEAISRQGQRVFATIERFPKPVLAAVGGYALGGGFELALACHLRIAGKRARFGLPEVSLGVIPGYGGTVRLARVVGLAQAVELTLTGEMFDSDRALEIGAVTRVVDDAQLLSAALELMEKILANGPVAVRMALQSVYSALTASTDEAMRLESALFGVLAGTEDMKEGMRAFLEKRKADFKGR